MKFDPRKPFDIWLDCFADVELADRPIFVARRCTSAEWEEFTSAIDSQAVADVFKLAVKALVGWKNQFNPATSEEVAYVAETAADQLRNLISDYEAYELIGKICRGNQVSVEDKKK